MTEASFLNFTAPSKRLSLSWTDSRRPASLGIRSRCVPCLRLPLRSSTPSGVPKPPEGGRSVCSRSCGCHSTWQVPPPWFDHLDGLLRTQGPGYIAIRCRTRFATFRVDDTPVLHLTCPYEQARIDQFTIADVSAFPPETPIASYPGLDCRSPQRSSHPSKNSPRQQLYRITAAAAIVPLPSVAAPLRERNIPASQAANLYQHRSAETEHCSNVMSASWR